MKTDMAAAMVNIPKFSPSSLPKFSSRFTSISITQIATTNSNLRSNKSIRFSAISCCFNSTTEESEISASPSPSPPDDASTPLNDRKPVKKYQRLFRRKQPGEAGGITEEMRFVAMRLRKKIPNYKRRKSNENDDNSENEDNDSGNSDREIDESDDDDGETDNENSSENPGEWEPDLRGLMSFLVENRHVFSTIERLVDESQDVSFAYFRKTGLERSESFAKDIDWLSEQNIEIPDPQSPSQKYAKYLEEVAVKNPPFFFCHLYNIYFSHIAGGQVILRKTSERILEGREMESCQWPGDPEELLKDMREKLNALGQHWPRDVKSKCLKEASKSFQHMGAIVRLMISPKQNPN